MNSHAPICYYIEPVRGAASRLPVYGVPRPEPDTSNWPGSGAMWSLDALLRILLEPVGYLRERREDCAFSAVASFCMIHAVVLTVVGFVGGLMGLIASGDGPSTTVEIARTLSVMALYASAAAIASFAGTVAVAALMHPLVLLVGGRRGYQATYGAVVYSLAPVSLLVVLALYVAELMPGSPSGQAAARWLCAAGVVWSLGLFAVAINQMQALAPVGGILVAAVPIAAVAAGVVWMAQTQLDRTTPTSAENPWRFTIRMPMRGLLPGLSAGKPATRTETSPKAGVRPKAGQRRAMPHRPAR